MLSKKRISLFILIFSFIIAIGMGVKAHNLHRVETPDLNFTSEPEIEISCNIDGKFFIHYRRTKADGKVMYDFWYEEPRSPKVSITAKAHGFGWAHILFYGNIDGKSYGDPNNTTSQKLGKWVGFLPVALALDIDHKIQLSFTGPFKRMPKEYPWDASGSIKLVPVYWKWRLTGIIPGGSWEEASKDFHRTATDSAGGSWTVDRDWSTIGSGSHKLK